MLLQLSEVPHENFAPAAFVGQSCLDPPQGLGDRLILLLEPLESPVDVVEVSEHLVSQFRELAIHAVEPTFHHFESTFDAGELASQKFDELLVLR